MTFGQHPNIAHFRHGTHVMGLAVDDGCDPRKLIHKAGLSYIELQHLMMVVFTCCISEESRESKV